MAIFPLSGAPIKGRVLASFPASVEGSGGISVTKEDGVWTIEPDWSGLDSITAGEIDETQETWVRDSVSGAYKVAPLSAIVSALGQTGAGISLNFTIDLTSTSDADPGAGKLRFNNASQNAATTLYVDDADSNGLDIIATIATLDDSTATVKGQLSLTKVGDATKRLIFNVTALTDASGYTKLTVANLASSATSPFVEGDAVLFGFVRTGDDGVGSAYADMDFASASAMTDVTVGDSIPIYDLSATTNKRATYQEFFDGITNLTAETAPDVADELVIYDTSGASTDKTTITNFYKTINGLTADSSPVQSTDYVATYDASASAAKKVLLQKVGVGRQTIALPAGSWMPNAANGCAELAQLDAGNGVNVKYMAFDASSIEYASCVIPTPKGWDAGNIYFRVLWTHPSTSTNFGCVWTMFAKSMGNAEALSTVHTTGASVTDTGGTTNYFYISDESSAIPPAGATKRDWLHLIIERTANSGSDTLAVDAYLLGVEIYYTTDTNTDD